MIWFILGVVAAAAVLVLVLVGQPMIGLVGGVVLLLLAAGWIAYRLSQVWSYCARLKAYLGTNVPAVQKKFDAITTFVSTQHPPGITGGGVPAVPDPNFP